MKFACFRSKIEHYSQKVSGLLNEQLNSGVAKFSFMKINIIL